MLRDLISPFDSFIPIRSSDDPLISLFVIRDYYKSQTGFNNLNVIRTRYMTKQKADPKITEVALNPNSD